MGVYKETVTETKIDQDGTETSNTVEKTKMYDRASEPDYIKLYIKPWTAAKPDGTSACSIPAAYRGLFIQLAMRMNYCNSDDIKSAQIVNAGKPFSDDIMKALNWKISMYYKGLSGLVSCGAITRIGGGLYRINPIYAARGEWRHNARLNRGGVKELIDELTNARKQEQYKKNSTDQADASELYPDIMDVDIKHIWADDGEDTDNNKMWREALGIDDGFDGGSLKTVTRMRKTE